MVLLPLLPLLPKLTLLILFLAAHAQMLVTPFEPYCQRMGWVICQISCTVFMLAAKSISITLMHLFLLSVGKTHTRKGLLLTLLENAAKGLAELDPASYVQLENQYRQLLQSNGLPAGFYDQTEDFTALLEGDVSPQELQTRVQQGFRAVQDADPEVKRQMQELYGVNEAGLAAYFLDPTKAAPILTRQAEAAKISARAKEQGRLQLLSGTAEDIAARGITAAEAEAGFTAMGLQEGLYTEMFGEQALTQQQKVGAALRL
jgi:hypothetical protein